MVDNLNVGAPNLPVNPVARIPGAVDPVQAVLDAAAPLTAPAPAADVNKAAPAVTADVPFVNPENITIPAARALDLAGQAHMKAGAADTKLNDLAAAVKEYDAAAADFEKEAELLIAAMNGGAHPPAPVGGAPQPAGGGAPATTSPTNSTPAGGATSPAWTPGASSLSAHNSWSSTGDPHEVSGSGLKFDNQKTGKFDLLQSANGDFRVQNEQGPDKSGRWPGATLNHKVAVKDGNDVVAYDGEAKTLKINGKDTPLPKAGETVQLPGGGKVEGTADGLKVTSSKGDTVEVHQKDSYIDLTGTVSNSRKAGEVRGGIGTFDGDAETNNDLMGRTGDKPMGTADNQEQLDKFEEDWRAKDDLFAPAATQPAGGGAPTTTPPAGGSTPTQPGGGSAPTQPSSPWTVTQSKLTENNTFSSTGDPHEVTGDGLKFDNQKTGNFDLLRSASGDLVVQNEQGPDKSGRWPGATLNHKLAVKDGNDVVKYDGEAKTLNINGKDVPVPKAGETINLPGGGKVTGAADGVKITTHKNDEINIHQRQGYIDITGKLGDRMGSEVRGGLGAFDADKDQTNDLKGRKGDDVIGKPGDKGAIDKFEEEWRTKPEDNLFNPPAAQPGGGGAPQPAPRPAQPSLANLFAALNALSQAAAAHIRAAQSTNDAAKVKQEMEAAMADYRKEAELIEQMFKQAFPAAGPAAPVAPVK